MSLRPGTRIGAYDIVAVIGSGGMGEVYRAMDSRLNRDIAIKALPEAFNRDSERVAREEEAGIAQINVVLNWFSELHRRAKRESKK